MAENTNAKDWLLNELEKAPIFQGWSRDDIEKAIPHMDTGAMWTDNSGMVWLYHRLSYGAHFVTVTEIATGGVIKAIETSLMDDEEPEQRQIRLNAYSYGFEEGQWSAVLKNIAHGFGDKPRVLSLGRETEKLAQLFSLGSVQFCEQLGLNGSVKSSLKEGEIIPALACYELDPYHEKWLFVEETDGVHHFAHGKPSSEPSGLSIFPSGVALVSEHHPNRASLVLGKEEESLDLARQELLMRSRLSEM